MDSKTDLLAPSTSGTTGTAPIRNVLAWQSWSAPVHCATCNFRVVPGYWLLPGRATLPRITGISPWLKERCLSAMIFTVLTYLSQRKFTGHHENMEIVGFSEKFWGHLLTSSLLLACTWNYRKCLICSFPETFVSKCIWGQPDLPCKGSLIYGPLQTLSNLEGKVKDRMSNSREFPWATISLGSQSWYLFSCHSKSAKFCT